MTRATPIVVVGVLGCAVEPDASLPQETSAGPLVVLTAGPGTAAAIGTATEPAQEELDTSLPQPVCAYRESVRAGEDVVVKAVVDGVDVGPMIGTARLSALDPQQVSDQCETGPWFDADELTSGADGAEGPYRFGPSGPLGVRPIPGEILVEGTVYFLDFPGILLADSPGVLLIPTSTVSNTEATYDLTTASDR